MAWLCALVFGVLAFALVGHALWWAIAAVFRELVPARGRQERRPFRPDRDPGDCPACGAACDAGAVECDACGLRLTGPTARALARVRVAQAEVESLAEAGDLDPDTAMSVRAQLRRRARRIRGLPLDTPVPAPRAPEPPARSEPPLAWPVAEAVTVPPPVSVPDPPAPVPPPAAPAGPPRRGSVLAAFMEERNILWGELVGGVLVVGCSIALVVTLWHRLEAFPYFPFLLSAAVTLALYAAGQYTLHRWKLTATSLGLLVITLLLAPLDLLLLADPVTRGELSLPVDVGVKVLAVALSAWVVRGGGRDVLTARAEWRWWLALAVVGPPAAQLLPAGWFGGRSAPGAAWLALACFAGPCVVTLRQRGRAGALDRATGAAVLRFLGLAAFALAAAWGLYVAGSPDVAARVVGLAVPLVLAGAVAVEAGLAVATRVTEGGPRAAGTAAALAGVAVVTAGLATGWSDPGSVLLGAAAAGLYFNRVAFAARLPAAIGLAVPSFALAVAVGYFGTTGRWGEPLARVLWSAECGAVLAALALALAALSEVLARYRSPVGPVSYGLGAAGVGCVALFLASADGLWNPLTAAAVHAACATGLLAANARWRLRVLAHGGLWAALVGSLWALFAAHPHRLEVWAFVVSVEALGSAALSCVLRGRRTGAAAPLRRAGLDVSIAAAVLAPVLALASGRFPDTAWDTAALFVLAVTGLAVARATGAAAATYLGAAAGLLGFAHLAAVTAGWEPVSRALLVGALTHATLAAVAAVLLRRRERVFARPLRTSAMLSSLAGGVLLFAPPVAHSLEWAGCAVWLATVWLTFAVVWRDRTSFSVSQVALALAAVLCGVAWVDARGGRPTRALGYFGPAALQVYAVALGVLGLGWAWARRLLGENPLARHLWTGRLWSAERVVLAVVVVGQLVLAAFAVLPEVRAELAPLGWESHRAPPPELAHVFGPGAWAVLGVLTAALLASWRLTGGERDTDAHVLGLVALSLSAPVVWAGSHAGDTASASALRWGLAAAFALGTAVVSVRSRVRRALAALGLPFHPTPGARPALLFVLAAAAAAVVFVSAQVAELGLAGRKASGPDAESVFAAMGPLASNLVPLALVVLGVGCSALRERSPGYAFAGGLVFAATVAAGYALGVVTAGGRLDAAQQLRVSALVAAGAAVWALAWLAAQRRVTGGLLLAVQARLGLGVLAAASAPAALALLLFPEAPLPAAWGEFGQYGWFALVLATGAAAWRAARTEPGLTFHARALSALIAGVLAACAAQPWDAPGTGLSFHALGGAWALVGVGLAVAARRRGASSYWLDGTAAVLAVLAVRGGWPGPWQPWASATLAAVASFVVGTSAVLNRDGARVVASGLLVNLAATLLWLPTEPRTDSGFLLANAAGFAIAAMAWTRLARRDADGSWRIITEIAGGTAVALLWFGLLPTLAGGRTDSPWLTWGATTVVAASMLVARADPSARLGRIGLFAASVALVLLGVSEATSRSVWNVWQTPLALAAYAVLHSLSWATTRHLTRLVPRPTRPGAWVEGLVAHGVLAAAVLFLAVRNALVAPELTQRLASPFAVLLLLGAATLLLRAVPTRAAAIRSAAVALGVLVCATAAWAVPDPAGSHPWLHRNAWLFVALAAAGAAGTELAGRLGANWRGAARGAGGACAAGAVLVLGVCLAQQVPAYDPGTKHTPLEPAAVLAVLLGILATAVLAVRFALRRDRDPLGLPDRGRTAYVYLAEALVALSFAHARLNVPELFLAGAVRYWTFAVMAVAFAGVGLAELFERRKLGVLAAPLRRTGVLVPLVPLLAFWARPPASLAEFAAARAPGLGPLLGYLEQLPRHFDAYARLWILAGGLYGLVALARNSFGWALLAALATNAAVWSLLAHHGVPFAVHPQAWVVPLALIVLVSEHVNRARLRPEVSSGLRYLGVGMVYVASSADMFLAGVGESVWLPVVLAVFCVTGVLAGMAMRVRAFVFLGVGFLLLDVFAMIWHAAVDLQHTWVWYASGIVLGGAILALFAVFEKRKRGGDAG
ncbi:hypothetical protein [Gemmata sp.]|uniref:hypothetical protein n=1 Tax=Gemmata sp. TaxID=1914242 RepID=UPI003F727A5F